MRDDLIQQRPPFCVRDAPLNRVDGRWILERLQVADELQVGAVGLRADELGRARDEEGRERGADGRRGDVWLPGEGGEDQRGRERGPRDGDVEAGREAHAQEGRSGEHDVLGQEKVGERQESAAERSAGEEEGEDEPSLPKSATIKVS